jgi:hypothetical protein
MAVRRDESVAPIAVFVDAVARDVIGARIDGRIAVVAIAPAEAARVAIVVLVEESTAEAE